MSDHLLGIVDMYIDLKRRRWTPRFYEGGEMQVIPNWAVVHFLHPWQAQQCMAGLLTCSTHTSQDNLGVHMCENCVYTSCINIVQHVVYT
jgi:hypothetical protein